MKALSPFLPGHEKAVQCGKSFWCSHCNHKLREEKAPERDPHVCPQRGNGDAKITCDPRLGQGTAALQGWVAVPWEGQLSAHSPGWAVSEPRAQAGPSASCVTVSQGAAAATGLSHQEHRSLSRGWQCPAPAWVSVPALEW